MGGDWRRILGYDDSPGGGWGELDVRLGLLDRKYSRLCGTLRPFRVQFNARWGRNITLIVLVSWVPVVWWLMPEVKAAVYTPFGVSLDTWTRHLFQVGLMLVIALSVMVLGKRGICKYLCPFNRVVRIVALFMKNPLRKQARK